MVFTETTAFVTVSCREVAAFVPDSLGQQRRRGRHVVCCVCLSALLLFGSFVGQLDARASCWCGVVCCFLLVVLLAADC